MERIILRHLKGSKASQIEEFPLAQHRELLLGRDPASTVRFDPDRDDLVGRQHARIVQDENDRYRFTLVDLNSRNGTFLNKLRVVGPMPLNPGDVIQLGAGGPELQFDLDPLPSHLQKTTRLADAVGGMPGATAGLSETRTGAPVLEPVVSGAGSGSAASSAARPVVGKATVERMITQTRRDSTRNTLLAAAVVVLMIAGVAAWQVRSWRADADRAATAAAGVVAGQLESDLGGRLAGLETRARMTTAEIVTANTPAIVQVAFSWKLIYRPTGGQVFHEHIPNRMPNGRPIINDGRAVIPAYIMVEGNQWEPALTLDTNTGHPAIGASSGGSGFVVTSDGFILTNRHVAANWRTSYSFEPQYGVLINPNTRQPLVDQQGRPAIVEPPYRWTPSETKQAGPKEFLSGAVQVNPFEARLEYLYVSFPRNTNQVEASIARVSDRHDVALIKVNVPESLRKVDINDNYDSIQPGDAAVVMGYPGVSAYTYAVIASKDVFVQEAQNRVVPDPTVSVGVVGKVIRGMDAPVDGRDFIYTPTGDTYQLTINSTGSGNSGGPMFDDFGRVTGIFFASKRTDAQISFAVPIRYGLELMSIAPNAP